MISGTRLVWVLALSVLVFVGVGIGTLGSGGGDPALNVTAGGPGEVTTPSPTAAPADSPSQEPRDQARTVERPQETTTSPEDPAGEGPVATETTPAPNAADQPATDAESETEPTGTPGSPGSGGIDGGGVELQTAADGLSVRAAGLLPGDSGGSGLPVRNVGNGSGHLSVTDVRIEDHENSLAEPERAAGDDAAAGELSSALRVRLVVDYEDGGSEFLAGAADEYVALDSLEGAELDGERALASGAAATVRLEWKLPLSAGNEVQTDSVDVDADLRLEGR